MRNVKQVSTVADAIYKYISEVSQTRIIGLSQMYTLKRLAEGEIGRVHLSIFQASHVVDHCRTRKAAGINPATINQDKTYLWGALNMLKLWKIEHADRVEDELEEAAAWLDKLGLVSKSRPRTRRPAEVELDKLKAFYRARLVDWPDSLPMITFIDFAIASCRRQAEITRIKWEYLDYEKKMYMVEDVKDPKQKKGNNIWFPALGDAWPIMIARPMVSEFVFPYNPHSVGASFTRAKKELGIINLRFHDLRREGATRLLEMGYTSSEVRLVTGHKTTNILDRVYLVPDPALLHLGPASMRNRPQLQVAA